jgi:hypothetical protein
MSVVNDWMHDKRIDQRGWYSFRLPLGTEDMAYSIHSLPQIDSFDPDPEPGNGFTFSIKMYFATTALLGKLPFPSSFLFVPETLRDQTRIARNTSSSFYAFQSCSGCFAVFVLEQR